MNNRFLDFFTNFKCICYSFWAFYKQKWKIFLPFDILQLAKSLPFDILQVWKMYPFGAEPIGVGHYREYSTTVKTSTVQA